MKRWSVFLWVSWVIGVLPAVAQPHLVGEPIRVTPEEGVYQQPVWSPDGRWIAVTGPRYNGIYLVRPDGSEFKKLTEDAAVGFRMSWSPDGRFLLGRAARWERRRRYNAIKVYEIATGRAVQLSTERTFMPAIPVWAGSPDRVLLLADGEPEVFEVPGGAARRAPSASRPLAVQSRDGIAVVSPEGRLVNVVKPVAGRYLHVAPSPDGERVAFELIGGQLYVCTLQGTDLVHLGRGERPEWTPDGQWLVFMVTEDDGHRMLGSDIWTVRVDGSQRTNLTATEALLEMNPTVSPDGTAIAYDEETTGGVYVARIRWPANR